MKSATVTVKFNLPCSGKMEDPNSDFEHLGVFVCRLVNIYNHCGLQLANCRSWIAGGRKIPPGFGQFNEKRQRMLSALKEAPFGDCIW